MNMNEHYQGLGHIAVRTADMDASIAFYERIGGRRGGLRGLYTYDS